MSNYITIFTLPKPFVDKHITTIQKNAIESWNKLNGSKVILMGEEEGLPETAKELGVELRIDIKKNKHGTPLLSSAFKTASEMTQGDILVYSNADIIIPSEFLKALEQVKLTSFLGVCRRWDFDLTKRLEFKNDWEQRLFEELKKAKLHNETGIDVFVFNKKDWPDFPDFAVGRPGWDVWFIYEARRRKIPVIDLTPSTRIIHQNHEHSAKQKDKKKNWTGPEMEEHYKFIGGHFRFFTIADADFMLKDGQITEKPKSLLQKAKYLWLTPEVLKIDNKLMSSVLILQSKIYQILYNIFSSLMKAVRRA